MPRSKHPSLTAIFCYLSLIVLSLQQCTLPNSNDFLQSGSSLLTNTRSNTRENLFTINPSFSVPSTGLQVAASVSSLQIAVTNGLDFSVRASPTQSSSSVLIILLIDQDNTWNSIRVSYLFSARSDFFLGFYVADIYVASRNSNSVNIQFPVPNWSFSQGSFTSIVQFSGVRTAANSFSISFSSLSFNPSNGILSLSILSSFVVPIENIYITYIILSRNSPIGFTSFNPSNPSPGTYSFVGLDAIRSSGSVFSGSAFTSAAAGGLNCVGSRCQTSCISSQSCTASGGQISGNICYLCAAGQVVVNGNCQAANQCGPNQFWSGNRCSCVSGYIEVNNFCYLMCRPFGYILNNQCVCIPGYVFSSATGQCVLQSSNCGTNYVFVNGNCVCPSGFGIINNLCLTCPANSFVNNVGNCQCVAGYLLSSTTLSCVLQNNCFPNSRPNAQGQCICNDGFYNSGNQCIPQTCQNGMVFNGVSCVCPTGQFMDAITNQCTFCNGFGQAVQGNTCVCSSTFFPTSTGCQPCPANSIYNSASRQCTCLSGFTLVNNQCTNIPSCPQGAQWNAVTSACQCLTQGHFIINNVCAPCPANSQWNGTACQCQTGFVLSGNACIVSCAVGSTWNGQSCVCSSGYNLIGGSCVICDPNSSYNSSQATCLCNSGFYGNWQRCFPCDSTCATCSGPANTQCTSCRGTSSLNSNGRCGTGCPSGQYVSPNNNCLPCIANCVLCFSGDSCTTCASGYNTSLSVVNGNIVIACTLIPTGTSSRLSLRSYVVGNSVVYQGVAMSLMPTQILADDCSICDTLLRVSIVSSFSSASATVSYVTNSQYWFLITFDFTGAAFIPTFQFTVQINPIHATYFSSADMAQRLVSAISPQTIYAASAGPRAIPRASTLATSGAPNPTAQTPTEVNSTRISPSQAAILAEVFK